MISIGWRNLKRDRVRMLIAVFGVIVAVVLVTLEVGMLLGMVRNASMLIDRSRADLWVSAIDVRTIDFAKPFAQRKKYLIERVPGVAAVEEFIVAYSIWRLPSGGHVNIQVIGLDERGDLAPSLNLVRGGLEDLHNRDAVIVDERERVKLGFPNEGDVVEIMQRKARVVGFTKGMTSFTSTPYIFTSLRRGERYAWLANDGGPGSPGSNTMYLLIKLLPGWDVEKVRSAIATAIPSVEVHTRDSFSWRTRRYWLFELGAGIGFLVAASLGLIIGGIVISLALYAMTVDRLSEFALLKAMGAGMGDLTRIVFEQALMCGALGLLIGLGVSKVLGGMAGSAGVAVEIPSWLVVSVILLTLVLCALGSLASVIRLRNMELGTVFNP